MKNKFLHIFIMLIISIVPDIFAHFLESSPDSVQYRFNPIVVTATKIVGAQKDLPASVSVLDQRIIQNSPTISVLELVKDHVPGVFFTERGVLGYGVSAGAAGGISIRGIGGSPATDVLVLRDGRPDIMGLMGHPIPDSYSLDGVERIEVIRGPASFLYGTNAMGGVINIVSKRMSKNGFKARLSSGYGSFATQKLTASHGGKVGNFDYYVTAAVSKTDGHRDYSGYEGDFYTSHLGYKISKLTSVEWNANLSNITLFDPGPITQPFIDHWYDIRRSGMDVTVANTNPLGESTVKVHGNMGHHKIYDGWRSTDYTCGLMFYHNAKPWSGQTTTFGFDIKKYGGDAEESLNKVPVINYAKHEIVEYAPYIHIQQFLLQRFIASAGIRLEHHRLYGNVLLPKIGLVTHISNSTSLRLSGAKGFRSPAIRELYMLPPRNEQLKPEQMWNYEIGLSQDFRGCAKIDAALFRSQGENMIQLNEVEKVYINSGAFDHSGYEIALHWLPWDALELSSSWTKLDLQDETLNSPAKKFTFYLGYTFKKFKLSGQMIHIRDLYGDNFRKKPMRNYSVANLTIDYTLLRYVSFNLSLKNAFNEQYQSMYGYPMPGRMLTAEMSFAY